MGLDNAGSLLVESKEWNKFPRPSNLHFRVTPLAEKPYVIGSMCGEWFDPSKPLVNTEEEHTSTCLPKEVHTIEKVVDSTQHVFPPMQNTDSMIQNIEEEKTSQVLECSNPLSNPDARLESKVNTISKDLATYINNEGQLTMDERRCEEHVKACRECDVSKQLSASDKLTLEILDNNLVTEKKTDGTVHFTTLYAFKKDPKEIFPPSKSNFEVARKQAEKTFQIF